MSARLKREASCCACQGKRTLSWEQLAATALDVWAREGCTCDACASLRDTIYPSRRGK